VGVRLPTRPDESFKLLVSGLNGVDAQYYPVYYVPYDAVRGEVRAKAQAIELLRKRNPTRVAEIDKAVAATGKPEPAIGFIPLRSGKTDLSVIVDRASGDVLQVSPVKPWGPV
jgi:hypothetical protein